MQLAYSKRFFNPLYWHLLPLLRDEKIRYIFIEGGASASKTYTACQALLLDMLQYGYSTIVFRRQQIDIKDSIYKSFKSAAKVLKIPSSFYQFQQHLIKGNHDNVIRFRGLDDEENIKGIEDFNIVYNNEWSQFTEAQFDQQRKRLRGKPNQKFICDWNPISDKLWIYQNWIDKDIWQDLPLDVPGISWSGLDVEHSFKRINAVGDTVWIKTTYRDNYWIVGRPDGKAGYIDEHTLADFERDRIQKPNLYRIYANGERGIIRTGGEFWKQFDETKHVKPLPYVSGLTVHVVIDENVSPYVTVALWQVMGKELREFAELPCKSPDNNAPKAAARLIKYLRSINYEDVVFIYGDPSADKRSTVDENSASFYDKFIGELTKAGYRVNKRVGKSAPQVALSATYINDIFEFNQDGYTISISDSCKVSIDDYASVKEAPDGSMLKPKIKAKQADGTYQTYEPHGHYSDQLRYFVTTLLKDDFERYRNKHKSRASSLLSGFQ